MDYSLLLGLDPEGRELVAGLVDAVGSFGLWKRLESAGKVGLRGKGREGEVTVVSCFAPRLVRQWRHPLTIMSDPARTVPRAV
jgi:hypothetical protein